MDRNFITLSKFVACYGILHYFYEQENILIENQYILDNVLEVMDMYGINLKQKQADKLLSVNDYLNKLNTDTLVPIEVMVAMINGIIEDELLYVKYEPKRKALLKLQENIIKTELYHLDDFVFDKADELNKYLENQIKNYRG